MGLFDLVRKKDEPGDDDTDIEALKVKAGKGDPEAQYQLGNCCSAGNKVPYDTAKMFYWYGEAAKQGHFFALFRLIDYYGKTPWSNNIKALYWAQKAAEHYTDFQEDLDRLLRKTNVYEQALVSVLYRAGDIDCLSVKTDGIQVNVTTEDPKKVPLDAIQNLERIEKAFWQKKHSRWREILFVSNWCIKHSGNVTWMSPNCLRTCSISVRPQLSSGNGMKGNGDPLICMASMTWPFRFMRAMED